MSDEKLNALSRVLRQRYANPVDAGQLRVRIVTSLQTKADRSRWRLGQVIAAFVLAAASSAWAVGRYAPQIEQLVHRTFAGSKRIAKPSAVRIAVPPAKVPEAPPSPGATDIVPALTVKETPTAVSEKPTPQREKRMEVLPEPVMDEVSNEDAQELDAYQAAHDAHFKTQDYRIAQMLWLQYLQSFPNGRLAPEAKYNRAVALLRLGDQEQANREFQQLLQESRLAYRHGEILRFLRAPSK